MLVLYLWVSHSYVHGGSVRSWVHYIEIRAYRNQLEHRLIAEDCKKIFILDSLLSLRQRMDYGRLKIAKNKTTPQNVEESNQNLFTARWNLPTAARPVV